MQKDYFPTPTSELPFTTNPTTSKYPLNYLDKTIEHSQIVPMSIHQRTVPSSVFPTYYVVYDKPSTLEKERIHPTPQKPEHEEVMKKRDPTGERQSRLCEPEYENTKSQVLRTEEKYKILNEIEIEDVEDEELEKLENELKRLRSDIQKHESTYALWIWNVVRRSRS